MATYNVHAGHCPQDQGAYGAVGILQESVEDRIVKNAVIAKLEALGHTVYDCTCDENTSQNGCLAAIVAKCNSHNVDLDISIHLNSVEMITKAMILLVVQKFTDMTLEQKKLVRRFVRQFQKNLILGTEDLKPIQDFMFLETQKPLLS